MPRVCLETTMVLECQSHPGCRLGA
ncbi:hypothetical protein MTR67_039788 [Solanum verrucosum]|uniref:Uncharacterized protein n=1 Tax=Solanum verrucosum TaxID=315347 RepID=A0AAF0UHH7_SOLVR|nr:hypothetical protein MTR67_039788 [Solanum verrucosum]